MDSDSETDTLIQTLFDEKDYGDCSLLVPPTLHQPKYKRSEAAVALPHPVRGYEYRNRILVTPADYFRCPDVTNDCGSAPLLHVFSVCINTPIDKQKPLEIYGNITIIEEQSGREFELFGRSRDEAETIYNTGASLSFSGPTDRGVSMSRGATLSVHLKDYDQEECESFVQHKFTPDDLIDVGKQERYSYDKIHSVVITGNNGCSVTVYYTTVLYGIDAIIDVTFLDDDTGLDSCIPADDDHLVLRAYSNKYKTEEHLRTVIFNEPLDVFVDEGPVDLIEKQIIVVPVYSSLIIDVYLGYHGFEISYGSMEFSVYTGPYESQTITTPWGRLKVKVDWGNSFAGPLVDTSIWGSLTPRVNVVDNDLDACRMEIFSIRVCDIDRDVLDVYGTITLCDMSDRHCIFQRDEKNPESLLPGRDTISIQGPPRVSDLNTFVLYVDLVDTPGQHEIMGKLTWTQYSLTRRMYDKRLCCVFLGEGGLYAVVHHTIFWGAFEARVNVRVIFPASAGCNKAYVHGSVVASYSNYEYLTLYENEYYKSKLFRRSKPESVLVAKDSDLPLLKSVVVATKHSPLAIELNLSVNGEAMEGVELPEDIFIRKLEFMVAQSGTSTQLIQGKLYDIEVSIKWTY